jgi:cyclopropane fatty-acyl-phospholipid synthase-like methyltransferase
MSRSRSIPPERLVTAVELLDVQPEDHILEIGCGRGVAAELICQRLNGGRLLALDRSGNAIAAASERNAKSVAKGEAQFVTASVGDIDPIALGKFDKVFAVNLNVFWTHPAQRELRLISKLIGPGGKVLLCYVPPGTEKLESLRVALVEHPEAGGYRVIDTSTGSKLLAITAQLDL